MNSRGDVYVDPAVEWRMFDALPHDIKAVLWNAPYSFTAKGMAGIVRAEGLKPARRHIIAAVASKAVRKIPKAWSKDHPCIDRFRRIVVRYAGAAA